MTKWYLHSLDDQDTHHGELRRRPEKLTHGARHPECPVITQDVPDVLDDGG